MKFVRIGLAAVAIAVVAMGRGGLPAQQLPPRTHLVIVVDGLRPDFVTAEVMPRLTRLGQRGIVFNAHHAVFPTVTRLERIVVRHGRLSRNARPAGRRDLHLRQPTRCAASTQANAPTSRRSRAPRGSF